MKILLENEPYLISIPRCAKCMGKMIWGWKRDRRYSTRKCCGLTYRWKHGAREIGVNIGERKLRKTREQVVKRLLGQM